MKIFGIEMSMNRVVMYLAAIVGLGSAYTMVYIKVIQGERPSSVYTFVLLGAFVAWQFAQLISSTDEDAKKRREMEAQVSNEQNDILNKFNNGEEIFIRSKRGFVTIPFVISGANGWRYTEDGRFVCGNEHFSLDEVHCLISK